MIKINKENQKYRIETDDAIILVLLEDSLKKHIENLEEELITEVTEELKIKVDKYKKYLKIIKN